MNRSLTTVRPDQSMVNWEASKPGKQHIGTIHVKSGSFTMKGDMIESGSFVIDMTTIASTDLEGGMKDKLEGHLKGLEEGKENDFFNVRQYPEAKFEITKVTKLLNDDEANHLIYGNLTIKDITKETGFKANVREIGDQIIASSISFSIDRTEWDIKFMSNKFFDNLKDNVIKDDVGLSVMLVGQKK